jgi:hypothetical protein
VVFAADKKNGAVARGFIPDELRSSSSSGNAFSRDECIV